MASMVNRFVYFCSILIIMNAVNVVIKLITSLNSSASRLQQRHMDSFCGCRNRCHLYATVHYLKPYDRIVALPKSLLSRKTLTRVGSDLDFDYKSCPPGSAMLDPVKRNAAPLHNDCPLLFVIGAQRSGTTSLYHYLARHSDFRGIQLFKGPLSGETYHFTWKYKKQSWERYKSHFPASVLSGEKSVGMFTTREAPQWLYESCGKTSKVILLLRNPTDRYLSAMGNEQVHDILVQLLSDIETYNEVRQFRRNLYSAKNNLHNGLYSLYLANWLCNFPSENILVLNSEEFRKSPAQILQLVLKFINLEPFDDYKLNIVVNVTYNYGKSREDTGNDAQLLDKIYNKLDDTYRSHNKKLFEILHWPNGTDNWPT